MKDQAFTDNLDCPVSRLKGVGPAITRALAARGVHTVEDLFYLLPIRYEDKRLVRPIGDVMEGERNVVIGRVIDSAMGYSRASRKHMCWAVVEDRTGIMTVKWFRFHKQWIKTVCRKDNLLFLSGTATRYGGHLQMVHPDVTILDERHDVEELAGIIPIYPEMKGLKQGALRKIIRGAFDEFGSQVTSVMPPGIEIAYGLPVLREAFLQAHFPDRAPAERQARTACMERLILEEFFLLQSALLIRRGEIKKGKGISMSPGAGYRQLISSLSFVLTAGQEGTRQAIEADMSKPEPMNRLVQGDVGCGKTICAVLAACVALDSGYQVAFMAPTEILAEQHYLNIHTMLEQVGVKPVLLRGDMGARRRTVVDAIANGEVRVVVGTHALLQGDVKFHKLGLIVIDEQHRFGVGQRWLMRKKGLRADILVMSATPIPRTLSMIVYGDLDVSVITDMPENRQKVQTRVMSDKGREEVYDIVRDEMTRGRQVFIVYPLVDESEKAGYASAKESLVRLRNLFPSFRVGLLHGRMKAEEKEKVMSTFKERKLDILACTTVIEVGIDIPNATVMVVEHAERFGLSQLHQLRGRVGRGSMPSKCFLMSASVTDIAAKRLRVLERTGDGFVIAEEDMKLRGPGDMLGVRQAGIPELRAGEIIRDGDLMSQARKIAQEVMASGDGPELERIKAAVTKRWGETVHLGEVL